jgi:uncharacterized protein (TIRG00374 family)
VKRAAQLILNLGITGGCFWWTFKDTDWHKLKESLTTANYWWLVPYLGILALVHLARTLRWGYWLSAQERISFKKLNEAAGIGFMMLIILPFRLGEFARPFLIAQRSKVRRSAAMTSVVLERVIDGLIIAVLLRVLLTFLDVDALVRGLSVAERDDVLKSVGRITFGANMMFAVFGGGALFLAFAAWKQELAVRLIQATAGRFSKGLSDKVAYIVNGFVGALRQVPSRKDLFFFFFFTAAYWLLNGWGMTVVSRAFDCSNGGSLTCQPMQLSLYQAFVVLCALIVGMMIPAAPGSAGTFQAFVAIALGVFFSKSLVDTTGVAYANVLWISQLAQQILYGLVLMVWSRQTFRDLMGHMHDEPAGSPAT